MRLQQRAVRNLPELDRLVIASRRQRLIVRRDGRGPRRTRVAIRRRYRLGVNYESLPVNKPRCTIATYYADGTMRFDGNAGGAVNYAPNRRGGPAEDPRFKEPPLHISGDADRYDHREGNDDYTPASNLYRLMPAAERQRLHQAIANVVQGVPKEIVERQLGHFAKADPAYAEGVRKALRAK